MHKIAESPMNTGFLRLYIYTFRYFEKEKQKNKFAENKRFSMWKTTFVASGYICFASYILAVAKVIFRLTPKLRYLSITCPRRKLHC